MQPSLTESGSLILPDETLDVVMYSCTSASVVIGDRGGGCGDQGAKPEAAVVTPTAASVQACVHWAQTGFRCSPLTRSRPAGPGPTISAERCFANRQVYLPGSYRNDREMGADQPKEIRGLRKGCGSAGIGRALISCTAVRGGRRHRRIEQAIGKPVVSSNYATAWACLRLCGDREAARQLGRLMELPLEGEGRERFLSP